MSQIDGQMIRKILLEVVAEVSIGNSRTLQANRVFSLVRRRLPIHENSETDLALLDLWHDLFRTGLISWGTSTSNPDPPFFHLTERGRKTLEHLSRDPANPAGYLAHIAKQAKLNAVAESYLKESLITYNSNCFKATAVLVGCAAESLVLELRDTLKSKLNSLNRNLPIGLKDWKVKKVLDAIKNDLNAQKKNMSTELAESFDAYWSAFAHQIRVTRNDAGHPTSIEPVTPESVHASLLLFPELMKLTYALISWIPKGYC